MKESELFELVLSKVNVEGKSWVDSCLECGIRMDEVGCFIEDVKYWVKENEMG